MELKIKPFFGNTFPKTAFLIKGQKPDIWFREIEHLKIDLSQVNCYAIPSHQANVLYGCLVVFNTRISIDIGKNAYFQCIENRFFIPENAIIYPKLNQEDWDVLPSKYLIMHPDFGLVELNKTIDWSELIQAPQIQDKLVKSPENGTFIPSQIKSYLLEIETEKLMEELEISKSEEEWMKNLPFDKKKVMEGNQKEVEKFLKYIDKYPDRAVELGIPLDIFGTSRGSGFSKYSFRDFFGNIFNGQANGGSNKKYFITIGLILLVLFMFSRGIKSLINSKSKHVEQNSMQTASNIEPLKEIAFESETSQIHLVLDSMYYEKREHITNNFKHINKNQRNDSVSYLIAQLEKLNVAQKKSKDSLIDIYAKKIDQSVKAKLPQLQTEIIDSIHKANKGKTLDLTLVNVLLVKKSKHLSDSLSYVYGTKSVAENKPKLQRYNAENESNVKPEISILEILGFVGFMMIGVSVFILIFKGNKVDFGGNNLSFGIKIFLILLLIALLIYLFYPLIKSFGYNWFVILIAFFVVLLLYRLFHEDKSILKNEDEK